jgi:hypothetical protein
MKKILSSLLAVLIIATATSNAYTPIMYLAGSPHLCGAPSEAAHALNDFMSEKKGSLTPSIQINSLLTLDGNRDTKNLPSTYYAQSLLATYHQKLDALSKGLYFEVYLPLTFLTTTNNTPIQINTPVGTTATSTITYSKIFDDITLLLGYQLLKDAQYSLNINASLICGARDVLFSNTGNTGSKVAPGLSVDGKVQIWEEENHAINFTGEAQYHFARDAHSSTSLSAHVVDLLSAFSYSNALFSDERLFFVDLGPSYHYKTHNAFFGYETKTTNRLPSHLLKLNTNIGILNKKWLTPFFKAESSSYISLGGSATLLNRNDINNWNINLKVGQAF